MTRPAYNWSDDRWQRKFDNPIETADRTRLNTLREAITYLASCRVFARPAPRRRPTLVKKREQFWQSLSTPTISLSTPTSVVRAHAAGVRSLNVDFGICANANETYRACGTETKAAVKEANSATARGPRKANGRGASAPRSSSKSRSEKIAALTSLRSRPFNSKVVDPLASSQLRS